MLVRTALLSLLALALLPAGAGAAVHVVAPGETLSGIAAANGLSASAVAAANGLSPQAHVIAGSRLTILAPGQAAATATPSTSAGYRVVAGDSLSSIAARQGVSLSALAAANGLRTTSWVRIGTTLRLPAANAPSSATSSAPEPMGAYKVRPGDTLSGLAAQSRVSPAAIAYMNGLRPDARLIAGTLLKLPTGAVVTPTAPPPARTIVPNAAPLASPGRLTSAQVASLAASSGVPSSLAAAIAWQESGFNNAMISPANARGVMQLLPGTWDWVQQNLSAARLDPSSASDNVKAGALYLGHLLRETNGDPALAAAAYYQGLDSVRRIGMLPETQRYVANVLALRARFGG